jgi:chromosome partitioning protein
MKTIAFFNNKGGVGKTSLVYHLAFTYADAGKRVLMVDLDPQSNLTAMCVSEERLEELWLHPDMERLSMRGAIQPIVDGVGDIAEPHLENLADRLALIPGDIRLSDFEQKLSDAWPRTMDKDPAAFRIASSFYRTMKKGAVQHEADLVLIDVGPNLGAINRSALISADFVVTPVGADLFSVQGLRNLGPTLQAWREQWQDRLARNPVQDLELPAGTMSPAGYVVMQPNMYGEAMTKAYKRWIDELPRVYAEKVLQTKPAADLDVSRDPYALAIIRHYRSLMPMAQTARKPIFKLLMADGAIGAHWQAVQDSGQEFRDLARAIDRHVAA